MISKPESVSLMVVGDDNQSIYAFRGANYENILLFGETYPDAKLIKLEQNYRSTPAVLDYINALSAQITLGYQKNCTLAYR
ncbi:UvrD-helicase domain-containing protein [Psychrobacter sp. WY6]|uniref:UvrD-helicase domain-containing protein n=1 Tax=Psychrobacter sp. WY6 TaxID=2708350 RepID=UPI0024DEAAB6|nr:UvrD-helicase domain-containing protein [Psychrobacter sp. WY6]